jgi:hypothetical protein
MASIVPTTTAKHIRAYDVLYHNKFAVVVKINSLYTTLTDLTNVSTTRQILYTTAIDI